MTLKEPVEVLYSLDDQLSNVFVVLYINMSHTQNHKPCFSLLSLQRCSLVTLSQASPVLQFAFSILPGSKTSFERKPKN